MRDNDAQLGKPEVIYKDTKANIEALTGLAEGSIAYATDTDEFGTYDGSTWTWGAGGGSSFDVDTILTDDDGNILVDDNGNVLTGD